MRLRLNEILRRKPMQNSCKLEEQVPEKLQGKPRGRNEENDRDVYEIYGGEQRNPHIERRYAVIKT